MNRAHAARGQRGFALVAALIVMVVLASLGAFAVRTGMSQKQTADLELLGARAHAAALAGVEYAAARLLVTNNCANVTPNFNLVNGFAVTLVCPPPQQSLVNGVPVNVFTVTSTASTGTYGTPEFVSRRVTVRVTS